MQNVKLHSGIAIIEVNDPLLLTEIESDPSLHAFLGAKLSDHCITVQPQAVREVVRRLQALGQMPRVIE